MEAPRAGSDGVTLFINAIREAQNFDVDFGTFTGLGRFEIVESTRAEAYDEGVLSLLEDDLCIAAQSIAPMREILRHVEAYQTFASNKERYLLRQGEHARLVTIARQNRITWGDDGGSFSIGVILPGGGFGAFRFHTGKSFRESLLIAAQEIPKGDSLERLQRWIAEEK